MSVSRILDAIRATMQTRGFTEARLAREVGVPQSTLNRSLSNPKRVTPTHRKICNFLGILHTGDVKDGGARDALVQTLMDIWDGSPEHAAVITKLLKAGSLLEAHGAATRRGKASHGHD